MTTVSTPCIKLSGVTKAFGIGDAEHYALNNVNLTVERGEFIAIMGPSGCGKTTLLNIIGLLDQPTDGEYFLNGGPVDSLNSRRRARIRSDEIGFVFQNFNLIPRLSVLENVSLPLTYKGYSKVRRLQEASRILKNFHLGEREYYMPHQLSGGQVQRVAIARALVNSPSIILADEPTGNLDSRASHIIMEELADIHRRGNTIIMVTHNPELTSYASRVITMLDGRIDTDEQRNNEVFRQNLDIPKRAPAPITTPSRTTKTEPTDRQPDSTIAKKADESTEPPKTVEEPKKPTADDAAKTTSDKTADAEKTEKTVKSVAKTSSESPDKVDKPAEPKQDKENHKKSSTKHESPKDKESSDTPAKKTKKTVKKEKTK